MPGLAFIKNIISAVVTIISTLINVFQHIIDQIKYFKELYEKKDSNNNNVMRAILIKSIYDKVKDEDVF